MSYVLCSEVVALGGVSLTTDIDGLVRMGKLNSLVENITDFLSNRVNSY